MTVVWNTKNDNIGVKVTKLHIDEYKVFKDFDIDFTDTKGEAQNLIVLAGINGTGKSTLLDYIYTSISRRHISWGGIKLGRSYIEVLNLKNEPLSSKEYSERVNEDLTRVFCDQRILNDGQIYLGDTDTNEIKLLKVNPIDYSNYDDLADEHQDLQTEIISKYIDHLIYDQRMNPSEAYKMLGTFIDIVLKGFDLGFSFTRIDSHRTPYFKNSQGKEIGLDYLSTGEKQLITLVLKLFIADIKDSVILIDEPEFSLHPSWQNKIVGVLQKYADEYNCQVILATHSPHIIGSVKPEQLRLLYKDESGVIKVSEHTPNSYGLTFDRILTEVMGVENLRTPAVDVKLKELSELIKQNEFDSPLFIEKMKAMEELLGYSDGDLILMRFEIAKRKKERATNK